LAVGSSPRRPASKTPRTIGLHALPCETDQTAD
jgi:hypothetical protein